MSEVTVNGESFKIVADRYSVPKGMVEVVSGSVHAISIDFGPAKIFQDGSIERTEKFTTTDAAALEFWAAVERLMPQAQGR